MSMMHSVIITFIKVFYKTNIVNTQYILLDQGTVPLLMAGAEAITAVPHLL